MRIVYVSYEYPPRFGGGIGTFVHAIARTLAGRGHDVTVITITDEPYPSREQDGRLAVVRLPLRSIRGPEPMATLGAWQSRAESVAALVKRMAAAGEADVIELADYRGEGAALLAEVPPGERPVCVIRLHTSLVVLNAYNASRVRHRVLEEFENQAILAADRIVSPSAALAREVRERVPGVGDIELSPYPTDPTFLAAAPADPGADGDEVLYVGRLEERKGVETLIAAAPRLLDANPRVRLALVGGDTQRSAREPSMRQVLLDRLPRRYHDRVAMVGAMPREQLVDRYRRARFCVFPSHFENFPNTCLEAMSLGQCVIGTDNSGMAEMIEDGTSGLIVRAADVDALAAAMRRLDAMAPADRAAMGRAARQRILDRYHPDAIAVMFERQYAAYAEAHAYRPQRRRSEASAPDSPSPASRPSGSRCSAPRVAVVIPCYNHGAFVGEAVASVRAQTASNVECVVVDDGSTQPATLAALDRLRRDGVRVIRQDNAGLAAARNTGVRATDAEFFVPLDADDRLAPTCVEALLRPLLDEPHLGYAYSFAEFFGDAGGVWSCPAYDPRRLLVENLSTATALVRRAAFDLVGGYSPDMVYGFEDWDFWLALLATGYHGRLVPEPLFFYRKHAGGSMLARTQAKRSEMVRLMIEHHRMLFATMLESSLVVKDAMFFDAHLRAAGLRPPGGNGASLADDELYQRLAAQAELDYIESSRLWRQALRLRRSAPYRLYARCMHGPTWQSHFDDPDPRERLRRIKASRAWRAIQCIKRTGLYRAYARRKYGPDHEPPTFAS